MIVGRIHFLLVAACLATATACAHQPASESISSAPPAPVAATEEALTLTTTGGDIFGTLQLPASRLPVPIVLIISGSGPTDRNGNTPALRGSNNSLKMLAGGLAARGIASLRYDKRGIAASRAAAGKEEDLRFNHFVEDAAAWAKKLRADTRFSTVTIAGHSEGSLIGMLAAREAEVDAFVSIAGAGRRPPEIILEQIRGQLPPELLAHTERILGQLSRGVAPDSVPPVLFALFRPSVQPYMISWFQFSPTDEIAKLRIPALIVQGTTDIQITESDAKLLAGAYPAARYVGIEGMNHVLKDAPADRELQMKVYSDSTAQVVPRLLDEIAGFVGGVTRKAHVHRAEPWFGADKLKHFFISAFIESLGFGGLQAVGADRGAALGGALGITAVAGVGREVHDRRTKGEFSLADLAWDAAGAGVALLVLSRTQR